MVGQLQSSLEVHSPRRRRVVVSVQVTYTMCDVAIADAADPLEEQPGMQALLLQVSSHLFPQKAPFMGSQRQSGRMLSLPGFISLGSITG